MVIIISKLAIAFFNKVLLPFYHNLNYKGVRLDGHWISYYSDESDGNPNQQINIIQKGPRIEGRIKINAWADNSPANEVLGFKGSIIGEKVFLTFNNKKCQNISYGAFVLQIKDYGEKLTGHVVSIEPTDLSIYSEERTWTKKS